MKIVKFVCCIFTGICAVSSASLAGQVTNMTDETQIIYIIEGNNEEKVEIKSYGNFSNSGGVKIRYGDQELYVEDDMEYAIWPGNIFGPQRTRGRVGG